MITQTTYPKIDSDRLNVAAGMLKAIAHPMRIAIIDLLNKETRLSVKVIHETLNLEQAVASHHLGILRDKNVLNAEREGKNIFYSLRHERLTQILECIDLCASEQD